ncbi:hypothetical protein KIH87_10445 [Paraneptunicella aestuarii]|uniref:DUF1302 family protein n=1 Tax=Paraneptunicella aestuarii TaxID=2831148 RepID=UPI001E311A7F|nr:DUF1302 family protein [Paraneptunicella aestuarii]UAA37167.1 hypothetical protein KIH87_10445 [Paraneptunicella aestuarii]
MSTALRFLVFALLSVSVGVVANPPDNIFTESDEYVEQPFDMDDGEFASDKVVEDPFFSEEVVGEQEYSDELSFYDSWKQSALLAPAHFTFRHEIAYGIKDPKSLVINRSSLRLQWEKGQGDYFLRFDGKASQDFVYNNADFSDEVKDKYRHQSEIREFYVQASKGAFSAKMGRQLVIWGKADGGIVTDVISPRDLTESVFTSIEDARIGQNMLVVDAYHHSIASQHHWALIVIPEIKVNDLPLAGHPYGIINQPLANIIDERPGTSWSQPEIGLRWAVTSGNLDWSVMLADVHENNPVFTMIQEHSRDVLALTYPRYQMLGVGFNLGYGGFVWKGELAFKKNRHFNSTIQSDTEPYEVLDFALGFDFNSNGAYTLSLELSNQHIYSWDSRLLNFQRDETVAYLVLTKPWLNETLTTVYTSSAHLQNKESFHRVEVQYDISDNVSTEIQVDYFNTHLPDSLFGQLGDKHRISAQIDFNF